MTAAIAWTFMWRRRECRADAGEKLSAERRAERSAVVDERVEAVRARQAERFAETEMYCNAEMEPVRWALAS